MKIDFKGILEGVWNSVFVKESIEKIARERMEICKGCFNSSDAQKKFNKYKTFRPDFHCVICGCDLHLKTRAMSQECPIGKWKAHMTEEQEYDLQKRLEDDGKSG